VYCQDDRHRATLSFVAPNMRVEIRGDEDVEKVLAAVRSLAE